MIPEICVDTNPAAQTLHQNLYNQLGPDYKIIQYIKKPKEGYSDAVLDGSIFWIQYKNQSLFLYLSDAPANFLSKTNESDSDSIKSRLFNHPEFMALIRFQNRLLPPLLQPHKARLTPFLMVFSNIDEEKLNIGIKSLGLYLLGKNKLASNKLHKLIDKFMGEELSNSSHHHLRCVFNPELAIYSHQVDNRLLDNEQEIAIKNDILLPNDKSRDKHLNLRGVNGSVNSGKSEVVLQRAKLFDQTTPKTKNNMRILILTPNCASQLSLNKRYYSLHPTDKKTEIFSLSQWCSQLLNSTKVLVDKEQILGLVDRLISKELYDNNINLTLFFQEVDFILGRPLSNKNDYLKATREFQISNLDDNQHKIIWETLLVIKKELALSNSLLDLELPQLLWASLQNKNIYEHYDHILLDDAHLLPPIAFDLVKKLIKPKTGQLFITQNPSLLLLNSCRLWQETGLELRGHSTRLLNNYEINPYILNAASSFYLHRLPHDTDKKIHRNLPDISENSMPTLLHFHSHSDEDNRLLNKVRTLINDGATPEDILLISVRNDLIPHYEGIFKQTLNIPTNLLNGNIQQQNELGLCSLLHAHGRKASYVFILGLHHIYEEEKRCGYGTDEYIALHRDNTKKLSVAMTCAKKELTLFLTSELIPRDFISPHIDIPCMSSNTYAEVHALHA
jgi:hypothetical protein